MVRFLSFALLSDLSSKTPTNIVYSDLMLFIFGGIELNILGNYYCDYMNMFVSHADRILFYQGNFFFFLLVLTLFCNTCK